MKLKHIDTILLVHNIEISKRFYEETLGLEILHDWKTMIVFKDRFAIHQADGLQPQEITQTFVQPGLQGRGNVVIYFQSNDLDKSFSELKEKNVETIHEIVQLPWEHLFRVYDPDGYIVEIGEAH
jgi:catechol 2,3-dioxygenase-like lactoylglutathione lyase family enzyme